MNGVAPTENLESLLGRVRAGDRDAAAEFFERIGPRLRRRVRTKLGRDMRRVFDSLEIMSTVARRLDRFVLSGRLRAETTGEFWSFLCEVAENAVSEKGRRCRTARRSRAVMWRGALDTGGGPAADDDLGALGDAIARLQDPMDREIINLWLGGQRLVHIASAVGLAPTAVRKRWQKIRDRLRDILSGEGEP
ncbi:MAG: ECF-type sigma factor [Phycisphaerales bacterium]